MIPGEREALELVLEAHLPGRALGELVAILGGRPGGVVGQPVLLVGQPDARLQRQRHPRLLVGLHLGDVDDHVGAEHGLGDRVLVPPIAVVRHRRALMRAVEAQPRAAPVHRGEARGVAELHDLVAQRVAGEALALQEAQVQRTTDAADVVEDHARHDAEVAQVDEVHVLPARAVPAQQRRHAQAIDDRLQVAAFHRSVHDPHAPAAAQGAQGVIEDGPQHRAVGRGARQVLAAQVLVEVLRRHEVRLDDDGVARLDEIPERVPVGRAGAGGVEAQLAQRGLDHLVDRVRRLEGRRQRVAHAGPRDDHDVGFFGTQALRPVSPPPPESAWKSRPSRDTVARRFPVRTIWMFSKNSTSMAMRAPRYWRRSPRISCRTSSL